MTSVHRDTFYNWIREIRMCATFANEENEIKHKQKKTTNREIGNLFMNSTLDPDKSINIRIPFFFCVFCNKEKKKENQHR